MQVSNVVAAFIATQAEDGYLGPFPKDIRLLKNWDLWGHYHAIYALVLWHEHTGDPAALAAARKAGDLVCNTYLDTGRRVFDAGDSEMNMSILTGMAMLHRLTGRAALSAHGARGGEGLGTRRRLPPRRPGRARVSSNRPRPRWESLHDLQGLVELWRITGEAKYRDAFIHHWRSIRRWDRRNTGGFSSGEQATGNPYTPQRHRDLLHGRVDGADHRLPAAHGRPAAADDLELATLNGGLGAQHPSGRWWTYNTPMDGVREASAHTIVFQARAGTPELNCCSVNGPRVLGMLSDWAVMSTPEGLAVNSYLPGTFTLLASAGGRSSCCWTGLSSGRFAASPHRQKRRRRMDPAFANPGLVGQRPEFKPTSRALRHRLRPVLILEIRRRWKAGDEVVLQFDFGSARRRRRQRSGGQSLALPRTAAPGLRPGLQSLR